MIRLVICDDHPVITQGLEAFLNQRNNLTVVATCGSGAELMTILEENPIDIVLLDINLPDTSGIELCGTVKKHCPDTKVIGFSNNNERSFIMRMLANSASGYLVKSASVNEIEAAIEKVYDGGIYFGTEAQSVLASLARDVMEEIPPVTKREKEVLLLLVQGLSSVQIAEKLFVTQQTVDTHRKNLMSKFSVNKTVNLLQKAKELGII